jgi:hypothetical protein
MKGEFKAASMLPGGDGHRGGSGGGGLGDGSRTTRPTILTAAVRFSPTGREWAAATTQGLQVNELFDFVVNLRGGEKNCLVVAMLALSVLLLMC